MKLTFLFSFINLACVTNSNFSGLIFGNYFAAANKLNFDWIDDSFLEAPSEENDKCRLGNRIGECREIRYCPPLYELLVRSRSRPSERVLKLLREAHCGFKDNNPLVCCPDLNAMRKDLGRSHFRGPDRDYPFPSSCGVVAVSDKIIGGNEAGLNEFPWMALIGYETRNGVEYRCGGTLINRRFVLTAAHCTTNLKSLKLKSVRLGEHDLSTDIDCSHEDCAEPPVEFSIKRVIGHPAFQEKELRNDIALIELNQDVNFTKSIQPICLPTENMQRRVNLEGETAIISGWGATENGTYSLILLTARIKVMPYRECYRTYNRNIPIFRSQICAGGGGEVDSCSGDSGGPLNVISKNSKGEDVYVQHGVVSFGPRVCGTKGKPGVYTRVSSYMDWITENIR